MSKAFLLFVVMVVLPFTTQAESTKRAEKLLTDTLLVYAKAVRWNDFELASESVDPLLANKEGFTEQDEAYYKRFQVSGYTEKYSERPSFDIYDQRVELRIIDVDSQTERTKTDHQTWRYDPMLKRWWLTSGLPKLD